MTEYWLTYYDPQGVQQDMWIDDFFNLEYTRAANDFGTLTLDLPPSYSASQFNIDGRLRVNRKVGDTVINADTNTEYFVRLIRQKTTEFGREQLRLVAYDANALIDRRINAYAVKATQSELTMAADNMMKTIMRNNFGVDAVDTDRDISAYLDIGINLTQAPSQTQSIGWQKLLPLFQSICDDARGAGTPLYFNIYLTGTTPSLRFETYVGQVNDNHGAGSPTPINLTLDNDGLSYLSYAWDYTGEYNFIYAGGTGQDVNRIIQTAKNDAAIAASPFSRLEDFVDATNADTNAKVLAAAQTRLGQSAAKLIVNGHVQQIPSMLYGVDYKWGDRVLVGDPAIEVVLETLDVVVDGTGKEDIKIYGRNFGEET